VNNAATAMGSNCQSTRCCYHDTHDGRRIQHQLLFSTLTLSFLSPRAFFFGFVVFCVKKKQRNASEISPFLPFEPTNKPDGPTQVASAVLKQSQQQQQQNVARSLTRTTNPKAVSCREKKADFAWSASFRLKEKRKTSPASASASQ
jgi:hypothetical protein